MLHIILSLSRSLRRYALLNTFIGASTPQTWLVVDCYVIRSITTSSTSTLTGPRVYKGLVVLIWGQCIVVGGILLGELVEVVAEIACIWVIVIGELKHHLLLLAILIAGQGWEVLNPWIGERVLRRIYVADVLICGLGPVLGTNSSDATTDLVILRVNIVLDALLVLAEHRLPIIDAALIRTLWKHMLL